MCRTQIHDSNNGYLFNNSQRTKVTIMRQDNTL